MLFFSYNAPENFYSAPEIVFHVIMGQQIYFHNLFFISNLFFCNEKVVIILNLGN